MINKILKFFRSIINWSFGVRTTELEEVSRIPYWYHYLKRYVRPRIKVGVSFWDLPVGSRFRHYHGSLSGFPLTKITGSQWVRDGDDHIYSCNKGTIFEVLTEETT